MKGFPQCSKSFPYVILWRIRGPTGADVAIYSPMVKKLLHTRYRVSDLDKTISFYKDVLGLKEIHRSKSPRGSELVFLKVPGSEEEIEICKFDASGPVNVGSDITH